VSVVTFARTARLWADGVPATRPVRCWEKSAASRRKAAQISKKPCGCLRNGAASYLANGINRVVMLTDGAANLGNVDPMR